MRHPGILRDYDPKRGTSVATLAYEYPAGYAVAEHAHGSDQLIYATSGLMHVSSAQSTWLIPPHFALWIPALRRHHLNMASAVSMRTLYFARGLVTRFGNDCCVLHVTALLRELIVEVVAQGRLRTRNAYEGALRDVLIRTLQRASPLPTVVTLPSDQRSLPIAQAVLANPGTSRSLAALCLQSGVGVRTIQRLFRKELGADFESWRRQVRLTKAVELLLSGSSVKETAFAVGYQQASAFVEMFRSILGFTPSAWARSVRNSTTYLGGDKL